MECPKCRKTVSDNDYNCPFCGTKIKSAPENPKRKKHKDTEKRKKRGLPIKKFDLAKKSKLLVVLLCLLFLIVMIITLTVSLLSSKGEKYAQTAAEYIGNDITKLGSKEDMHFGDESQYYSVNSSVTFDYVYESEKTIKAGGASYPQWAVFAQVNSHNYVTDIIYTDFSVLKKDIRGNKQSAAVSLDRFSKGDKQNTVLKYIDMDPYSIHYSQSGIIIYTYRYYYKRENGDEQQTILRAAFNEDGEFQYYNSQLIFPVYM